MNQAVQPVNEFNDFVPTYFNEDIVRREGVRYLFFPGDVIGVRRKQERQDLAHGGEEIGSPCLVRVNRFLRRCRISPLERWGDPMPAELMPEGVTPIGLTPQQPPIEQGLTSFRHTGLQAYPVYPGDEITWILAAADDAGVRKGIVELTPLRAIEWGTFEQMGIQKLFFPEYPKLPVTLSGIDAMIGAADSQDSMLRKLQEEMVASCSQFRLWGNARMDAEDLLVKVGALKEGWTYRYTDLGETLMPQLERGRVDQYMHDNQKLQASQVDQQARLTDAVVEALGRNKADQVDVGAIVTTMQAQMAETTRRIMEDNHKFMAETLARLLGPDDPKNEAPPAAPNGANKPKPGGNRT